MDGKIAAAKILPSSGGETVDVATLNLWVRLLGLDSRLKPLKFLTLLGYSGRVLIGLCVSHSINSCRIVRKDHITYPGGEWSDLRVAMHP